MKIGTTAPLRLLAGLLALAGPALAFAQAPDKGDTAWMLTSTALVLTERYTRTAEDTIDYRFTMHDPTTYVQDWTVGRPMRREVGKLTMFEYACHEGNIAMAGILAGARKEEKDAAARR